MVAQRHRWYIGLALLGATFSTAWAGEDDRDKERKSGDGTAQQTAEVGKPAPDFTLKDLDGNEHKLSDHKGKIAVLEWTNHQCPFIVRHEAKAKTMQKIVDKYKDRDIVFLAINSSHFCEKEKDTIAKFADANDTNYPVLLDADGTVGRQYDAKTTPHMFVINKDGVLVYSGAIDDDVYGSKGDDATNYVVAAIDAVAAGKEVEKSRTQPYGCSVKYHAK